MRLDTIDLRLLLAFQALIQERSVSRAAARLGLRQPAMSAALGRLRTLMNDELFVRAAGAMQATPKALRIAPGIDAALAQLQAALDDSIPFAPEKARQRFTIASTDYTTVVLLPALLADFSSTAPQVDLRIIGYDKGDIPTLLDRGDIDLALGVFKPPPDRAVRKLLCAERFVGLVRRGHPALRNGKMTIADYAAARHALVTVRRDAAGEIDQALALVGLKRRVALTLPHMLALPHVLAESDLVAALPRRIAKLVDGKALRVFELPVRVPEWRIEMLWNAAARRDEAAKWLRSRVVAAAAALV